MALTIGTGLALSLRTRPETLIIRRVTALVVPFIKDGDIYGNYLDIYSTTGTAWGLYVTGEDENYFSGNVGAFLNFCEEAE